jgi:D-alanine-D-alanine ligase
MKQGVLVYHTALSKNPTPDDLDVLEQSKFVSGILKRLGYNVRQLPFEINPSKKGDFDEGKIKEEIKKINPLFIFNLVESIQTNDSLAFMAPSVFEDNSIPYTGCTKDAFFKTRNKIDAKIIFEANGILTPYWISSKDLSKKPILGKKFIMKFGINNASKNMGESLITTREGIKKELKSKRSDFFAEEYIEGREFNISMIGSIGNGEVLPIAEMKFVDWPSDKLKIVSYSAKWDENSEEYKKTKRVFEFPDSDRLLLEKLEEICKKCWNLFNLRGYARIDFRVSKNNIPYVLEINTNPCISPDAGFIAAAHQAGMSDEKIMRKIIECSCGKEFIL